MFKFNQLVLAVCATLTAGQALAAVTQSDIQTARGNGALNEAWISGASAPTYNVLLGFAAGCDTNTLSVFNAGTSNTVSRPGSSAAGNFLAYACARGGVVSVLYHTVDGGSFNAYAPHIPNDVAGTGVVTKAKLARLSKLDDGNSTCARQTVNPKDAQGNDIIFNLTNQANVPSYSSCATRIPANSADGVVALPAGGFSDVEAALFGVSVEGYGVENNANVGQAFGIATSISLYRAMQAAQGITAADPDFLPVNAPTISRAQYASIVSGSASNAGVLIPGSTDVLRVARRVATSGTQASSNATFLRNPCNGDPAIGGVILPSGVSDSKPKLIFTEGSGTGNAKSALSVSGYAIGVLSMENDWNADSSPNNGYRFIKLDNVHPEAPIAGLVGVNKDPKARYTAAQGSYDFHMEMKSFVADSAAGTFGETVINEIVSAFSGLACDDVPRGLTLNPFSGSSCTAGITRARGSRDGNNCRAQQLFF